MSSIFIVKPIVDAMYEEVKGYKEEIDRLNRRIKELEVENAALRSSRKKPVVAVVNAAEEESEDDENFAEAAAAPPSSSPAVPVVQEEKHVKQSETVTTNKEEGKQVRIINGKDAKEYMKEYQRNYRKKQKDITLNL
jgi:hypothetical protein